MRRDTMQYTVLWTLLGIFLSASTQAEIFHSADQAMAEAQDYSAQYNGVGIVVIVGASELERNLSHAIGETLQRKLNAQGISSKTYTTIDSKLERSMVTLYIDGQPYSAQSGNYTLTSINPVLGDIATKFQ